jgi:hypothetical protein
MNHTGRYFIKSLKTGKVYCVEPIDDSPDRRIWGDFDPSTKKFTGKYGEKYRGSIRSEESIITKENGFKNIRIIGPGISPENFID